MLNNLILISLPLVSTSSICYPTLNLYVSLPMVQENIANIKQKVTDMTTMMCDTVRVCKSSGFEALASCVQKLEDIAARLENPLISSRPVLGKESHSLSIIHHKLEKNGNTNKEVFGIAKELYVHQSTPIQRGLALTI